MYLKNIIIINFPLMFDFDLVNVYYPKSLLNPGAPNSANFRGVAEVAKIDATTGVHF